MAVYGDLRYLSYYGSVADLLSDEKAVTDCIVNLVIDGKLVTYQIIDHEISGALPIPNVGWAVPIKADADVDMLYTTHHPIPIDVGGIKRGDEFERETVQEVLDKLFFPSVDVYFNLFVDVPVIVTVGSVIVLHDVHLTDIIAEDIEKIELYIDGECIRTEEPGLVSEFHFLINRTLTVDTEVKVIVYSSVGTGEQTIDIKFQNPIYWGVVAENFNPTVGNLDRLEKVDYGSHYFEVYSNGDTIFIAVETDKGLKCIYDKNGNDILDNFTTRDIAASINGDRYEYKAYQSSRVSVMGYPIRVEV